MRNVATAAIDLGASKVALRLCGDDSREESAKLPPEPAVTQWRWLSTWLTRACAERPPDVLVAAAAPTVDERGIIHRWPNCPGWVGLDLAGLLLRASGAQTVAVLDDGQAAAVGEAQAGGLRDVVVLTVGTGLATGLVRDGEPRPAPELAHRPLATGGACCVCGRTGCAQAWLSGPAMLSSASEQAGRPIDWPQWAQAFEAGRIWAREAVADLAERLAMIAVHAGAICHIDTVVVTGRPVATLPALIEHAARTANTLARSADEPRLRLQRGLLGGQAPLTGACHLASSIAATGLMRLTTVSRALPAPRAAIVVVTP